MRMGWWRSKSKRLRKREDHEIFLESITCFYDPKTSLLKTVFTTVKDNQSIVHALLWMVLTRQQPQDNFFRSCLLLQFYVPYIPSYRHHQKLSSCSMQSDSIIRTAISPEPLILFTSMKHNRRGHKGPSFYKTCCSFTAILFSSNKVSHSRHCAVCFSKNTFTHYTSLSIYAFSWSTILLSILTNGFSAATFNPSS